MKLLNPDLKFDLLSFCRKLKSPFTAAMLKEELAISNNQQLKSLIDGINDKLGGYLGLLCKANYIRIIDKTGDAHANLYEITPLSERNRKIKNKPLTKNAQIIFDLAKKFNRDFTFNEFKAKLIKLDNKIAATLPDQVILNYFALLERKGFMNIKKIPKHDISNIYHVISGD